MVLARQKKAKSQEETWLMYSLPQMSGAAGDGYMAIQSVLLQDYGA